MLSITSSWSRLARRGNHPGFLSYVLHILAFPMGEYEDHESSEDTLHILRHSTAHLLAAAVTELHPRRKDALSCRRR